MFVRKSVGTVRDNVFETVFTPPAVPSTFPAGMEIEIFPPKVAVTVTIQTILFNVVIPPNVQFDRVKSADTKARTDRLKVMVKVKSVDEIGLVALEVSTTLRAELAAAGVTPGFSVNLHELNKAFKEVDKL